VNKISGRGIVIKGSHCDIEKCLISSCAATGIYVGERLGRCKILSCDLVGNGVGNSSTRGGGISAGHSGIYQESGRVDVNDCNISRNTFTGFSGTNRGIRGTKIEDCDFFNNRGGDLELLAMSTERVVTRGNVVGEMGEREGKWRTRWGELEERRSAIEMHEMEVHTGDGLDD